MVGAVDAWIAGLFENKDLLGMGHHQRADDLNLGLGWIYYGLVRTMRPQLIVSIGSYRGFVPLVLGKALADNGGGGEVVFIDPSMVDDFWKDAATVEAHFAGHGVTNVRHHLMTTQEFAQSEAFRSLGPIGLLFVDGYHSAEQARIDHETFEPRLRPDAIVLFHDSIRVRLTRIYGADKPYEHRVRDYMEDLKRDGRYQVFDIGFGGGLSLVQKADAALAVTDIS
jgi:predicted O-methyltransferase YrrM